MVWASRKDGTWSSPHGVVPGMFRRPQCRQSRGLGGGISLYRGLRRTQDPPVRVG